MFTFKISGSLRNPKSLKSGSVWALYLALATVLNLLKKYVKCGTEENTDQEDKPKKVKASGSLLQTVCKTIVEPDIDLPTENFTADDDNLLEVGEFVPKESVEDVKYGNHLTKSQPVEINSLINDFGDIFTDKPGTTNLVEHHIELTSDDPIRLKPYPIPYSVRESLKQDISDMLKMGVIRESNSPYATAVVIVRKKDGTNWICVDYRKINKITVFDPEPMTNVTDLFSHQNRFK